jgi:hypothetical protein
MRPDGGTIVTSVASREIIGRTFAGSWMSLRWIDELMSSAEMSTSIASGMASAGQRTSIECVTMLTAPPRFTPGEVSALRTCTGMLTRMVAPTPRRMKSTWIGKSLTGSSW